MLDACVLALALSLEPSCASPEPFSVDFASSGAYAASFGSVEDLMTQQQLLTDATQCQRWYFMHLSLSTWLVCFGRWMSWLSNNYGRQDFMLMRMSFRITKTLR
jgi:hypothetical protein